MRFRFPLFPAEFEIPDDWWREAGMNDFTLRGAAYRSRADATLILLRDIEPPFRLPEHALDFHGFRKDKMLPVLTGLAANAEIDPVPLLDLPLLDWPIAGPFRYRVQDGVHRFYASIAAGFESLPAVIS